jgi:hypothetical protein
MENHSSFITCKPFKITFYHITLMISNSIVFKENYIDGDSLKISKSRESNMMIFIILHPPLERKILSFGPMHCFKGINPIFVMK